MPRGWTSGCVVQACPDAQRTPQRFPSPPLTTKVPKMRAASPFLLNPLSLHVLATFPPLGMLFTGNCNPHSASGRTSRSSPQPLRHEKALAEPKRLLEHRVERGFSQFLAHPLSRRHDSHRACCTLCTSAPACLPRLRRRRVVPKLGQDMRYPSVEMCGSCFEPKIDPGAVVKRSKMARRNAARFGVYPQRKTRYFPHPGN